MTGQLTVRMQVVRFLGLGAVAAGINYGARFAFDPFMAFEAAVALAYLVGMVVAFILFQRFVFGDAGDGQVRQAGRFVAVNMVGIVVALAVSSLMARFILPSVGWTFHPYAVAHAFGIMAPTLTSYVGHRFFTYRKGRV